MLFDAVSRRDPIPDTRRTLVHNEDSTSHSPRRQAENLTFRSRAGTGARRRSEPLGSVLAANAPGNEVRPLIDEDTTMVARRIDESRPLLGVHIQRLQLREAAS